MIDDNQRQLLANDDSNCVLVARGGTLESPAYIGNVVKGTTLEKNLDFCELGPQRINETLAKD